MRTSSEVRGPVLLVRAAGGEDSDAEAIRALGISVIEDPYLVVTPSADEAAVLRADHVLEALRADADVLLLTSRAALRALDALVGHEAVLAAVAAGVARGLRGAAVGPSTAEALRGLGVTDVLEPDIATSRGLLAALRAQTRGGGGSPGRAVLPCGAQAMKGLGSGLSADGWDVDEVVVYTTDEIGGMPSSAADLAAGRIPAVVLRSPTAVRAVARHVPTLPPGVVAVCGGPTTAAAVVATWHVEPVVSSGPTAAAVARSVDEVLATRAQASAAHAESEGGGR
jgi:uroporphyrinogen-III synthase